MGRDGGRAIAVHRHHEGRAGGAMRAHANGTRGVFAGADRGRRVHMIRVDRGRGTRGRGTVAEHPDTDLGQAEQKDQSEP